MLPKATQASLSLAAAEGFLDETALAELYQRYAPLVHARVRRLVGDEADDIVQEVFLRLLRAPPRGQPSTSWFYTVSTNLALDRLRHQGRRRSRWLEDVRTATLERQSVEKENALEDKELCRKILATLDRKTQEVVMLVVFDEMNHQETANQLGISRKTVYARLQRFLAKAEKMLKHWDH